jgi:hypothetical protein
MHILNCEYIGQLLEREVSGSNLAPETAILTEGFCGFSQPLQANAEIVP